MRFCCGESSRLPELHSAGNLGTQPTVNKGIHIIFPALTYQREVNVIRYWMTYIRPLEKALHVHSFDRTPLFKND